MKPCPQCQTEKPNTPEFFKIAKHGLTDICRDCINETLRNTTVDGPMRKHRDSHVYRLIKFYEQQEQLLEELGLNPGKASCVVVDEVLGKREKR